MPGIAGFKNNVYNIDEMTTSMLTSDKLKKGDLFSDGKVTISEVKLTFSKNNFIENDKLVIFVDGNCFNINEINNEFGLKAESLEYLLCFAYENDILDKVLNKLNGFFSAIIYDKKNAKINLISDRHGTRLIYYYFKDDNFAFGAEIKSLLTLKDIDLTIDKKSFECFMELGYILKDNTWFENIKLIKPSSILEYDINKNTMNQHYYWKYTDIHQKEISFEEAVDKLAELLPQAVLKMYNSDDEIVVPLSGGFDSRMIAVSLYEYDHEIKQNFATMGQQGCRDIEISSKIAKIMKQPHRIFNITNDDAISDRINDLWNIDGLISLQNMHGMNLLQKYPKELKTFFSGIVGGELYGAVYKPEDKFTDKLPTKETFENIYKSQAKDLIIDDYYQIPRYYPLILDNAIRKFSIVAMQKASSYFNVCLPFLENNLLDFLLSVPDEYKKDYKLYRSALIKAFPYWYTKIPFQSASGFNPETKFQAFKRILKTKIKKFFKIRVQNHFFDYGEYIKRENIQNKIEDIFKKPNKFLKNQHCDLITNYISEHWNKEKYNPDIALKLVSAKTYFDIVDSKINKGE